MFKKEFKPGYKSNSNQKKFAPKVNYQIGIDYQGKEYKYFGELKKPTSPIIIFKLTDKEKNILKYLRITYPVVFNPEKPLPLSRMIHVKLKEVLKEANIPYSSRSFYTAMKSWCGMISYKRALTHNTHRYDLEGNKVEEITKENKEEALKALKFFMQEYKLKEERKAKWNARKKAPSKGFKTNGYVKKKAPIGRG